MKQTVVWFGGGIALLLIGLKVWEYSYRSMAVDLEVYIGVIALLFLVGGLWIGKRWFTPTVEATLEKAALPSIPNPEALKQTGISKREQEVLEYLAQGYSNQEIADRLFVSLNTIKTHVNNLYSKLDVKRRTQAVARAKELMLIP